MSDIPITAARRLRRAVQAEMMKRKRVVAETFVDQTTQSIEPKQQSIVVGIVSNESENNVVSTSIDSDDNMIRDGNIQTDFNSISFDSLLPIAR